MTTNNTEKGIIHNRIRRSKLEVLRLDVLTTNMVTDFALDVEIPQYYTDIHTDRKMSVDWQINSWPTFSPYLYKRVYSELTSRNSLPVCAWLVHTWEDTSSQQQNSPRLETFQAWNKQALMLTDESVNKVQLQRSWIKLVRPLFTVEHSRQWSD